MSKSLKMDWTREGGETMVWEHDRVVSYLLLGRPWESAHTFSPLCLLGIVGDEGK